MTFTAVPKSQRFSPQRVMATENSKFTVVRLCDGAEGYLNTRPRRDSQLWNHQYMIWDNRAKFPAIRPL
jgi:hypothetical protein